MISEEDYRPEKAQAAAEWFVVISGCSGGGKSSLLAELAKRGYRTFAEAGRQIIKEQTAIGRPRILADDPALFTELCVARTMHRMVEAADGLAEYPILLEAHERFGYRPVVIPKAPVPERADFVLRELAP